MRGAAARASCLISGCVRSLWQNSESRATFAPIDSRNQDGERKEEFTMNNKTITQIGMVGLGRMGANMVRRLLRGGRQCVVYDRSPAVVQELVREGAVGATSLEELAEKLT